MNCNELKQLINETSDLAALARTPEAGAHLKTCSDCQVKLTFEEKLRGGFAVIASEAAPPDLAAKIMAIQAEQLAETAPPRQISRPGWLEIMLASLQGFPFKVAFAAGFTGFLAAVLILRQPQTVPVSEPTAVASKQRQEVPAPANDQTHILTRSENKNLSIQADKEAAKEEMQLALAPEKRRASKAEGLEISEMSEWKGQINEEERIPGAITFTLDSSADTFVTEKSSVAPVLADQPAASEADMQLAMTPLDRESAGSTQPSAPTRSAAPAAEMQPRIAASRVAPAEQESGTELKKSQPDAQSGEELRQLIETNAIDLPEGFINLDELAMRGYLPSAKLRRLRPPSGNGWYLQKSGDRIRIFLKKR